MIDARQPRDAGEHEDEDSNDGRKRAAGRFDGGLAKCLDSIADRFHTGHGRAAAGEGLKNHPGPGGGGRGFEWMGRHDGGGMATAQQSFGKAQANGAQQADHKEVGRRHEHVAGFTHATKID